MCAFVMPTWRYWSRFDWLGGRPQPSFPAHPPAPTSEIAAASATVRRITLFLTWPKSCLLKRQRRHKRRERNNKVNGDSALMLHGHDSNLRIKTFKPRIRTTNKRCSKLHKRLATLSKKPKSTSE